VIKLLLRMTNLWAAILKTLPLFLIVCLLISPVYADPIPGPPPDKALLESLQFVTEVLLSELVAGLLGAELLLRLWRRKNKEASRSDSYKIMLVAMTISFLVGLVFWWFYGWI
jgi:hypothetical protein